ncbi:MAG: chromosome segregation protein SMC, partial [Nanoarchaeota archaeon]|nr:chromosome segregation protein SMC [Nanoarchaeota archaeon]
TIHFHNKGNIPLEDDIVSVSRRINKAGVSTYRLNGKVITKQQMVDILSPAGIHPDGQNIMQQGEVTHLVEIDSIQRRQIIDDISGISEYDDKRNKALKELEKIDAKVREAEIVLHERENIMERLSRDRDAAIRYRDLNDQLNQIRAAIVWKSFSDAEESMKDIDKKLDEKNKELQKLEKEIQSYDNKLEEHEDKLEEITKDVIQASSQIEVTKKIARLQGDIEVVTSKLESNKREIERINSMSERLKSLDKPSSPQFGQVLKFDGVHGFFSDLVMVPAEYTTAVEIAAGGHMRDIIVDTSDTAVRCVKYLKENRIGRARFLQINKIRPYPKKPLPKDAIGWLSEIVHHDPKYNTVMEFVLGSTACVKTVDTANQIFKTNRVRMVTLDGDLFDASGAITGGHKKKNAVSSDLKHYMSDRKNMEKETESLEKRLRELNKELEIYASKEKKTQTATFERGRVKVDELIKKTREARKESYEKRLVLQQEVGKLSIRKARSEADFDNYKVQAESAGKSKDEMKEMSELTLPILKKKNTDVLEKMEEIGPVNMKAIEEFELIKGEFTEFKEKVDKIVEEKDSIEDTLTKIEEKRRDTFYATLKEIAKNFKQTYKDLTNGEADMDLEDPNNLDSGLMIRASPPGKRLLNLDAMSGGEKTLTSFAFVFSIHNFKPKPFYVLDEADAALDKTNTKNIVRLIKKHTQNSQFIVISHNDTLIKEADQVYGVTMENGESKIMGIELPEEDN